MNKLNIIVNKKELKQILFVISCYNGNNTEYNHEIQKIYEKLNKINLNK